MVVMGKRPKTKSSDLLDASEPAILAQTMNDALMTGMMCMMCWSIRTLKDLQYALKSQKTSYKEM